MTPATATREQQTCPVCQRASETDAAGRAFLAMWSRRRNITPSSLTTKRCSQCASTCEHFEHPSEVSRMAISSGVLTVLARARSCERRRALQAPFFDVATIRVGAARSTSERISKHMGVRCGRWLPSIPTSRPRPIAGGSSAVLGDVHWSVPSSLFVGTEGCSGYGRDACLAVPTRSLLLLPGICRPPIAGLGSGVPRHADQFREVSGRLISAESGRYVRAHESGAAEDSRHGAATRNAVGLDSWHVASRGLRGVAARCCGERARLVRRGYKRSTRLAVHGHLPSVFFAAAGVSAGCNAPFHCAQQRVGLAFFYFMAHASVRFLPAVTRARVRVVDNDGWVGGLGENGRGRSRICGANKARWCARWGPTKIPGCPRSLLGLEARPGAAKNHDPHSLVFLGSSPPVDGGHGWRARKSIAVMKSRERPPQSLRRGQRG